jgi:membrane protein DedA with SNARE-associated domain
MHLRAPSIDRGVSAFIWSVVFFLVIYFGGKAVGVAGATSFILGLVAAFLIFVFVRTRGTRTTTGEL